MEESARVMKGTMHENTWMVYHDALSLMTANKTKEWMRQKNYLRRWILPSDDLYDNLPQVKAKYKQNPVGNSPEFMPWDAHLNQDVHASHDLHCATTQHLSEEDRRKFSGSTPKRMWFSYKRLLDPDTGIVPSSRRIVQDVTCVLASMRMVRDAEGCIIDETSVSRSGRRHEIRLHNSRNWGGKRTKGSQESYRNKISGKLHRDARAVRDEIIRRSARLIDGTIVEQNSETDSLDESSSNKNSETNTEDDTDLEAEIMSK